MQCMPCSSRIISETLPEIHTIEKVQFSHTYNSFSNNLIFCYTYLHNSCLMDISSIVRHPILLILHGP